MPADEPPFNRHRPATIVRCATCGEPWPCDQASEPPSISDEARAVLDTDEPVVRVGLPAIGRWLEADRD